MLHSLAQSAETYAPPLAPAHDLAPPTPGPQLTIVIPTRNERDNVRPVYEALCRVLDGVEWEAIFVDDDSTDGTPDAVTRLACRRWNRRRRRSLPSRRHRARGTAPRTRAARCRARCASG